MSAVALVWANSPWAGSYLALRDLRVGTSAAGLDLTLGGWASDGLLAVFFFLVGLELKRELVAGDLRHVRTAIVPVAAAAGGVVVPALLYTAIVWQEPGLRHGWAVPTATDIAFAVAVLALIGSHLPSPLRVFLLTLAVADDLMAIGIIAAFYTDAIRLRPLLIALVAIAVYGVLAQRFARPLGDHPAAAWLVLLPLGVVAWAAMHASGIHATIAGVLLAFTAPATRRSGESTAPAAPTLAEHLEHRVRPLSAGVAVPAFAFFSAGVAVGGVEGLGSAFGDRVTIAIIVALVLGKPVGIMTTTWLVSRLARLRLDPALGPRNLGGLGLLAGIGFTVSLLVAELSFAGTPQHDHAKVAILTASLLASLLAAIVLVPQNRRYREMTGRREVRADVDVDVDVDSASDADSAAGIAAGTAGDEHVHQAAPQS